MSRDHAPAAADRWSARPRPAGQRRPGRRRAERQRADQQRTRSRRWLPLAAAVAAVVGFTAWTGPGPLPLHAGTDSFLHADPITVDVSTAAPASAGPASPAPSTAEPSAGADGAAGEGGPGPAASGPPPSASPAAAVSTAPARSTTSPPAAVGLGTGGDPLGGAAFYVDPSSDAAAAVRALQSVSPADAELMARLARGSSATWFGDAEPAALTTRVRARVSLIRAAGALPVLVAYAIPNRDCGSYSAGGMTGPAAYRAWISAFAAGVRGGPAIVILEPDGISLVDCLSATERQTRYELLRDATAALSDAGATVYLDAGNAGWHSPAEMATRLRAAGVDRARGFALNVSNFDDNASEIAYGRQINAALGGGAHFVVDTSRNGQDRAPDRAWCNPPGRGLGVLPTTATGEAGVDAFLWIKVPGESDGTCNGGPPAGRWWPEYALGLARLAA